MPLGMYAGDRTSLTSCDRAHRYLLQSSRLDALDFSIDEQVPA